MIQEMQLAKFRLWFELEPDKFASDNHLLYYFQHNQAPEPEVIHVMLRALKAGDCAVDAGANIGFFTVLMSKLVGDKGRVIAIEPDSQNSTKLLKNLDLNSCNNVTVFAGAIGADEGEVLVHRHEDNGQSSLFGEGEGISERVRMVPLDTLIGDLRPTLLKMDIEGSEVAALRGCTYLFPCIISEINPVALERAGTGPEELFKLTRLRGYERYLLHANGAPPSRIRALQKVVAKRENANMLFATDDYVSSVLWPEVEL